MLARTETLRALAKGRNDAILQQVIAGKIEARDVTKVWRSAGDLRVRHTHAILNGREAMLEQAFLSPSGALLMYPHDPDAPPEETVGCRCILNYRVDYTGAFARRLRAA
jgi:hypothetical protein